MEGKLIIVVFECSDAYMSIADDGSYITDVENRIKILCDVFDFEYKLVRKGFDHAPHLVFNVSFLYRIVSFQHYMNVLAAFAQEFQVNIANAFERDIS